MWKEEFFFNKYVFSNLTQIHYLEVPNDRLRVQFQIVVPFAIINLLKVNESLKLTPNFDIFLCFFCFVIFWGLYFPKEQCNLSYSDHLALCLWYIYLKTRDEKKKNPCREWHDIRDDVSKLEKA